MLLLRSLLFYIVYCPVTIMYGTLSLPILWISKPVAVRFILSWNAVVITWLKWSCGINYTIKGNTLPLDSPCVIIANHQSPWETLFLQLQFVPASTVLKKELLSIPFFGWGLRILDPISIDRSHPTKALKQIKEMGAIRLQTGYNLLIFPEGTRMPVGELGTFMRSGADIAKQANIPIIAVAHDAGKYWENKRFIKKPGIIQVTISEPIGLENKTTKEVTKEVKGWIEAQLNI